MGIGKVMIILETPRLTLRQLALDDLEAVTTLYSDSVVMATKGGVRSPEQTEQQVKGYLEPGAGNGSRSSLQGLWISRTR